MPYPYLPDLAGCEVIGIQRGPDLDPTISTPFENGMQQTRPRFPRVRRCFVVPYRYVPTAQAMDFREWIRTTLVGSSGIFVWIDPLTGEEINVRFASGKIPQITEAGYVSGYVTHSFNLELEEV